MAMVSQKFFCVYSQLSLVSSVNKWKKKRQLTGGGSDTNTSCAGYSVLILMPSSDGVPAAAAAASCCLSIIAAVVRCVWYCRGDEFDGRACSFPTGWRPHGWPTATVAPLCSLRVRFWTPRVQAGTGEWVWTAVLTFVSCSAVSCSATGLSLNASTAVKENASSWTRTDFHHPPTTTHHRRRILPVQRRRRPVRGCERFGRAYDLPRLILLVWGGN